MKWSTLTLSWSTPYKYRGEGPGDGKWSTAIARNPILPLIASHLRQEGMSLTCDDKKARNKKLYYCNMACRNTIILRSTA